MEQAAVFEFFVRRSPEQHSFPVAAGLEQVLEYLQNVRFTSEEIAWLASTKDEVIEGQPLLHEVMTDGHRLCCASPLEEVRVYCAEQLARLPPVFRTLVHMLQSPVKVSHRQHELAGEVAQIPH